MNGDEKAHTRHPTIMNGSTTEHLIIIKRSQKFVDVGDFCYFSHYDFMMETFPIVKMWSP